MEIYSEPRITKEGERWGLKVGEALDLKTGWDLKEGKQRPEAEEILEERKPKLLRRSPESTPCCKLRTMNKWTKERERSN